MRMVDGAFSVRVEAGDTLGECPRWDGESQRLYWVDIKRRRLQSFVPATGQVEHMNLDEDIGCFARHVDGGFVAGLRSGIWRLDEQGHKLIMLAANPENTLNSRFNDGRADVAGRFWAGTVDEGRVDSTACLYRLDARGLTQIANGLMTSNGVAFSPDGQWLYHADTPRFIVYRYPYSASTGDVGTARPWARFPSTDTLRARPDGAAVDEQGCYWCALFEGGAVARLSPEGELLEQYALPVRCPTMVAFGDDDLRTLYVTSARENRSAEELADLPLSGGLFSMRVSVPGLPEPVCTI